MDREDHKAQEDCASADDFERALDERYRRLSLLTLDLAEEAGEAAVNFSLVNTKGVRPAFFDRRLAAMTRAIWAHRVIERLRGGGPAAKAATLRSGAKDWCDDAASIGEPMAQRLDDRWTPRSSRGESEIACNGVERTASNQTPTRHGPAANAANKKNSANAAFIRESAPSRAGMASISTLGDNAAGFASSIASNPDGRWTPHPRANAASRKNAAKATTPRASAPP